jgi:hypothetical protein
MLLKNTDIAKELNMTPDLTKYSTTEESGCDV